MKRFTLSAVCAFALSFISFPAFSENTSYTTSSTKGLPRAYTEIGCVIASPNCAGTRCTRGEGYCNEESSCAAIPGGCVDSKQIILTNIEQFAQEHVQEMVNSGLVDPENADFSYELAKDLLLERANSLP